jgi:hypothetical protein
LPAGKSVALRPAIPAAISRRRWPEFDQAMEQLNEADKPADEDEV